MLKIGVLASHEGTTLQCILDACTAGRIQGEVVVVISNNRNAGALSRAKAAGIPAHHLSSVTHPTPGTLDAAISAALSRRQVDVVFLAGYLKRLGPATLTAFNGRVLNTHPALLPKFGGHGMFGDHVFEAVLASGESESGVSLHLVDDNYDTGRVVRQVRVSVKSTDSVESLKARSRDCEREVVVQTLAAIAAGELQLVALDDLLKTDLTIVFCGTAAGLRSATLGHYYAGHGNQFWKVLAQVGLTPRPLSPHEYPLLTQFGIGLTDVVKGQAGNDSDITFHSNDSNELREKIVRFQPRYLCFNGKRAAKAYFGTATVTYGIQPGTIGTTKLFVAPSTSGAARGHWDVFVWQQLADLARSTSGTIVA